MKHQRMQLLTMMTVLKPSQLQLIRRMHVQLLREPKDEIDSNSATDLDANEALSGRPVGLLYTRKDTID